EVEKERLADDGFGGAQLALENHDGERRHTVSRESPLFGTLSEPEDGRGDGGRHQQRDEPALQHRLPPRPGDEPGLRMTWDKCHPKEALARSLTQMVAFAAGRVNLPGRTGTPVPSSSCTFHTFFTNGRRPPGPFVLSLYDENPHRGVERREE